MDQIIRQFKCVIVSHRDQYLVGICQNAKCQNSTRSVCIECVREYHQNDNRFALSDIASFDELQIMIDNFKKKLKHRNDQIYQKCQIEKFLLLKKLQQQIFYWEAKFKKWEYVDQMLQQINQKLQDIKLENYINQQYQNITLQQFLDQQFQIELNEIELIVNRKESQDEKQKVKQCKSYFIDKLEPILQNVIAQVEKNSKMSGEEIFESIYKKAKKSKKQDHSQKAIHYLDKCIKSNPQFRLAFIEKAELLKIQGDFKASIKCLNKCIKISPQYEEAFMFKAQILKEQGNLNEALDCLDQCIKINPQHEEIIIIKGLYQCLMQQKY